MFRAFQQVILEVIFEFSKVYADKKPTVIIAPMPEQLPIYEKGLVVEHKGIVDLTRKPSGS